MRTGEIEFDLRNVAEQGRKKRQQENKEGGERTGEEVAGIYTTGRESRAERRESRDERTGKWGDGRMEMGDGITERQP